MPPAFNLSQDQTLQFNPLQVTQSTLAPSPSPKLDTPETKTRQARPTRRQDTPFASCEHQNNCLPPKPASPATRVAASNLAYRLRTSSASVPTPIGCSFLKNR